MKTCIRGFCFGFLWLSWIAGCAAYPDETFSPDANLVQVTGKVQRAVVKITTYDAEKKRIGMGSGFFIDKDGVLITNYHVLDGAYASVIGFIQHLRGPQRTLITDAFFIFTKLFTNDLLIDKECFSHNFFQ